MKNAIRLFGLIAVLGLTLFGAARPAAAIPLPPCTNPIFAVYEEGYYYNLYCQIWAQGLSVDPNNPNPGKMDLYDGFVSATIDGIPGTQFKAFMYQVVPTPANPPEGWRVVGYGVSIFYDNGNVNPEGVICFKVPEGIAANFNLGVFGYDGTDYYLISQGTCGSFQGGGEFFLLIEGLDPLFVFPMTSS